MIINANHSFPVDMPAYLKKTGGALTGDLSIIKDGKMMQITSDGIVLTEEEQEKNMIVSSDIKNIVKLTQEEYDALAVKDSQTLYVIPED